MDTHPKQKQQLGSVNLERHYTTVTVYWMLHITITTEPGKLHDDKQMQERDVLKDEGKWIVSKEDAFAFRIRIFASLSQADVGPHLFQHGIKIILTS